jgi:hypothetical protein
MRALACRGTAGASACNTRCTTGRQDRASLACCCTAQSGGKGASPGSRDRQLGLPKACRSMSFLEKRLLISILICLCLSSRRAAQGIRAACCPCTHLPTQAHGWLMAVGWTLILLGILAARHTGACAPLCGSTCTGEPAAPYLTWIIGLNAVCPNRTRDSHRIRCGMHNHSHKPQIWLRQCLAIDSRLLTVVWQQSPKSVLAAQRS